MKDKLVFALDVPDYEKAEALVKELKEYVGVYKVGKELFTACGPSIYKMIQENGGKVFADVKYHDIPNTVASASKVLVKQGVDILNVHASGGFEMMNQTKKAVDSESEKLGVKPPVVLAVTVLTSLSDEDLNDIGVKNNSEEQVIKLAKLAKKAGLDGVVASPKELKIIKKELGEDFIVLTPGIRPTWSLKGDQKRVMTPGDAIKNGSDYIVVGRPIRTAEDRKAACKKILQEMKGE